MKIKLTSAGTGAGFMLCLCCLACSPDSSASGAMPDVPAISAPTVGLDSTLIAAAYDSAARMPRLRSLLIARHGDLLHERYYHGATRDTRANIKSASKSIISALVGIAIAEGKLEGVDQEVAPLFRSYLAADADPRINSVTVGHLLSMQSGLEPTSFNNYGAWVSSSNWVRNALNRPFIDQPGGRMLYSTGSTHILSAVLTKETGMSTYAYARSRLFQPMGVQLSAWTTDPQGIYFGGNEMRLRPRDLLTFAELYRNRGMHNGTQIIPSAWIDSSWVRRTTSPYNGHGYGRGWWMRQAHGHDVFFAWGYGGQYAFIVPDLELIMIATSDAVSEREGEHNRALHDLLRNYIVPAAERGKTTAEEARATDARLPPL